MARGAISFGEMYRDIHGREPFAWQAALARRVGTEGWPAAISMPTASGKTSVLDVAVWHLACEAGAGRDRKAPVRVAMVVDRRVSVDDSYAHARAIAEALNGGRGNGAAKAAGDALRGLSSGDPLTVKRLRGGMPQDSGWRGSPSDPTIILSTIDQVGSRLLFRGYGVSRSMRPVHAGLLGTDTLYILDEAHLSGPFMRLLQSTERLRAEMGWGSQGRVVQMSATLRAGTKGAFPDPGERPALLDDMGERMSKSKPASMEEVGKRRSPAALARLARRMMGAGGARRIGIVANTVGAAREAFEGVRSDAKKLGYDARLLTGRSRPLCRDILTGEIVEGLRPDSPTRPKSVTVSTQCIEAGADITFDALLTQAAPLDSLLQRFGRLNRIGKEDSVAAVIVADGRDIGKNADDPVYGTATAATWSWLAEVAGGSKTVDFGTRAFRRPPDDRIGAMSSPGRAAVTLLPAYVRAWHKTMPPGSPDPEAALFLHGMPDRGTNPADVSVVWRQGDGLDDVRMSVQLIPPSALESIEIPVWHVRRWLEGLHVGAGGGDGFPPSRRRYEHAAGDLADIDGQRATGGDGQDTPELAVRVGHRGQTERVGAGDIRPGDTIAVPSSYGGCDEYGWTGAAGSPPVKDISMQAHLVQRGRLAIRIDGGPARGAADDAAWDALEVAAMDEGGDEGMGGIVARTEGLPGAWRQIAGRGGKTEVVRRQDGAVYGVAFKTALEPALCRNAVELLSEGAAGLVADYSRGWDGRSGRTGAVTLDDHLGGVRETAEEFAAKAGLGDGEAASVRIAAQFHDIGKRELTMQAVLHGTTQEEAKGRGIIAKSAGHRSRKKMEACKRLARMPDGYRHEWHSVLRAREEKAAAGAADPESLSREVAEWIGGEKAAAGAADPDLVLWLIGTHHGHGRPVFPAGTWIDGVVPWWCSLAARVYRKHGPWKLAHMEAVLRLADGRRSAEEGGARLDGAKNPRPRADERGRREKGK